MAITLAEAKVGMADKVDQQVVDEFRRSSLLLDRLVFDNAISPGTGGSTLTYGYIQLKPLYCGCPCYQQRIHRRRGEAGGKDRQGRYHGRFLPG